jgi:hypothetical protein
MRNLEHRGQKHIECVTLTRERLKSFDCHEIVTKTEAKRANPGNGYHRYLAAALTAGRYPYAAHAACTVGVSHRQYNDVINQENLLRLQSANTSRIIFLCGALGQMERATLLISTGSEYRPGPTTRI